MFYKGRSLLRLLLCYILLTAKSFTNHQTILSKTEWLFEFWFLLSLTVGRCWLVIYVEVELLQPSSSCERFLVLFQIKLALQEMQAKMLSTTNKTIRRGCTSICCYLMAPLLPTTADNRCWLLLLPQERWHHWDFTAAGLHRFQASGFI